MALMDFIKKQFIDIIQWTEDDGETIDCITNGLRDHGHTVARAADGREGLRLATAEAYDLLIVDRMLPGMDGLSIVKTVRGAGCKTPVLFLSTLSGIDDRVIGLNAGGDDYLGKPFAFSELLARVSVTALEPEDIEALCNALYKIPKTVEKFAERYAMAASQLQDIDFSQQISLLEEASDIILKMLQELRRGYDVKKISQQNSRLQDVEGEADKLMLVLLKDELYSRKHDAVKVIILKDLYELLEKVVDRCRDAGNVISHIVLKES